MSGYLLTLTGDCLGRGKRKKRKKARRREITRAEKEYLEEESPALDVVKTPEDGGPTEVAPAETGPASARRMQPGWKKEETGKRGDFEKPEEEAAESEHEVTEEEAREALYV